MRFSQNELYIDSYIKCCNCGVLIYEKNPEDWGARVERDKRVYCSQWCVDWEDERAARRGQGAR